MALWESLPLILWSINAGKASKARVFFIPLGTFLGNSECDRVTHHVREKTISLWYDIWYSTSPDSCLEKN